MLFHIPHRPVTALVTWLDFGGILLETLFCQIFFENFGCVFFKVKHVIGHISAMVGPIGVKRKGGASVGYWVNYGNLTFDLTHDLDLWFFKVKFQNSCIWGIVIWLMWNKKNANQSDTGLIYILDGKVHGANMVPSWVLSAPDGPHVGRMNLAIWDDDITRCWTMSFITT